MEIIMGIMSILKSSINGEKKLSNLVNSNNITNIKQIITKRFKFLSLSIA